MLDTKPEDNPRNVNIVRIVICDLQTAWLLIIFIYSAQFGVYTVYHILLIVNREYLWMNNISSSRSWIYNFCNGKLN